MKNLLSTVSMICLCSFGVKEAVAASINPNVSNNTFDSEIYPETFNKTIANSACANYRGFYYRVCLENAQKNPIDQRLRLTEYKQRYEQRMQNTLNIMRQNAERKRRNPVYRALRQAEEYYNLGDYKGALEEYRKVIQGDRGVSDLLNGTNIVRGYVYDRIGEITAALGDTNESIYYFKVAMQDYFRRYKDYDKTIAIANKILEIDPNSEVAFYYLALSFSNLGETKQEETALLHYISVFSSPEFSKHSNSMKMAASLARLGDSYRKQGEFEKSIETNEYILSNSDYYWMHPAAYWQIAWIYFKNEKYEDGIDFYKKSICSALKHKEDYEANFNGGWFSKNHYNVFLASSYNNIGVFYGNMDNREAQIEYFRAALDYYRNTDKDAYMEVINVIKSVEQKYNINVPLSSKQYLPDISGCSK
ncbi:tetratricopeptide repeat protein [Crocosphaera sp.]|uniref:tetratricopeptide repeat protein n=1 Tax=Crocosphaera sp. TaxID=2729996 RepID=UPI00260D1AE3|nr:tetratricopeptide repeat protein [Crocosphaera sp.]MDJ0581428.1 tetratricopeptide repeat protein [Crocosphaera sp.]